MKAISLDLRRRVIEAHEQEGQNRRRIAKRFKVNDSWLGKFLRRRRETGSIERLPCRGGNRSVLSGPNLLDNMDCSTMSKAVQLRNDAGRAGKTDLEASGGITLDTTRAAAQTGVERIAIGALTHSATALDISLEVGH